MDARNFNLREYHMRPQYPLPDEYLIELGRLVALSSQLEQQINTWIGKLAGFDGLTDPTPFIIVNHSSTPQKIDMMCALCEERLADYPHLIKYKDIIGEVKSAIALRNKFVHSLIDFDKDKGCCVLMTASARGKIKVMTEDVRIGDIYSASKSVHKAMVSLARLVLNKEYEVPDLF